MQGAESTVCSKSPMTRRARVLIVEDDPVIARGLDRRFRSAGLEVELANTLQEALSVAGHFDGAVIDLHLPDGSGLQLYDALQGGGRLERAIFFSATTVEEERNEAARRGEFVPKDASVDQLVLVLLRTLFGPDATEFPPESSTRSSHPSASSSSEDGTFDGDRRPAGDTKSSGEIPRVGRDDTKSSGEMPRFQMTDAASDAITKTK